MIGRYKEMVNISQCWQSEVLLYRAFCNHVNIDLQLFV